MLETFLREIADHPEDLAARHAFADWLSEQPDPDLQARGEFIATQLELHVGRAKGPRARELIQREHELLVRYQEQWARPILQTNTALRCVFRNGMIEAIVTHLGLFLEGVQEHGLLQLAPIHELILRDVTPRDADRLASWPERERITALTLERPPANRHLDAFFTACRNLPRLSKLAVNGSSLGDEVVIKHLVNWPGLVHLTHLSLRATNIGRDGVRALMESPYLDPLRHPVQLKKLDLRGNRFFRHDDARFLLDTLRRQFSPQRMQRVHEWLRPVEQRIRPRALEERVRLTPQHATSFLLDALRHPNRRIRWLAINRLQRCDIDPAHLPELIRRFYEPGLSAAARGSLLALRPQLSSLLRTWLDLLLVSDDPGVALTRALRRNPPLLPEPVLEEFVALCQRRLRWRTGHGRATPLVELPTAKEPEELVALAALVAGKAEEAADRHLPAGRSVEDRTLRRALAGAREYGWLASWLIRLLMQA